MAPDQVKKVRRWGILATVVGSVATGACLGLVDVAKEWTERQIGDAMTVQAEAQEMGPRPPTLIETRVDALESRIDTLEGRIKMEEPKKIAEVRGSNDFYEGWIDMIQGRDYTTESTERWREGWRRAAELPDGLKAGALDVITTIEAGLILVDSLETPE
jgi:hypothetical protein